MECIYFIQGPRTIKERFWREDRTMYVFILKLAENPFQRSSAPQSQILTHTMAPSPLPPSPPPFYFILFAKITTLLTVCISFQKTDNYRIIAEQRVKKGEKKMIIGISLFFSSGVVLGPISAVFISILLIGNNIRLRHNYNIRTPVRTILQ